MNSSVKSTLLLGLVAMIWGFAFVAQRSGMESIGPFLFNALRCLLGAVTVYAVVCLKERRLAPLWQVRPGQPRWRDPTVLGGVACGVVLFSASTLQQVGLVFTTASKAGFLTALYVVLVPVFGLVVRHRAHWNIWLAVALSAVGLYLLSITEAMTIAPGDLIVLVGAGFWAGHILVTNRFVHRADVFRLCITQFLVAGILSAILFPAFDGYFVAWDLSGLGAAIRATLPGLLFVGVLSSGIGFTGQAFGQRGAPPTVAAVVMSLEAVFATIGGLLILHERLTLREAVGCGLMFGAVLLAELPIGRLADRQRPAPS
jgi:drug/metabolite transporter (DMT)-like permease